MFARPNESTVEEVEAVVDSIVLRASDLEAQSVAVAVAFATANGIAVAATVSLVER